MPETRLETARWALIIGLAALSLGFGLGAAGRLSYHEAFVAQAAREMSASGEMLVPTIGGQPWLEKPPLAVWLVVAAAKVVGGVGAASTRLPSAIAAGLLTVAVAVLTAHRFGATAGLLAGLVQATSLWTVIRGRLAEADMLLACLLTWTLVAFDRLRDDLDTWRVWRLAFFAGLGLTALAKGIGFGAVLVAAIITSVIVCDRDWEMLRRLNFPAGWVLAAVLGLAWPLAVLCRYPSALELWTLHISDRLAARPAYFASTPWWQYGPAVLSQVLPWTPLALIGAARSLRRAWNQRGGCDRLLWAWTAVPLVLLSLATVKKAHYAIYALPPWSVWAALSLERIGARLTARGWTRRRICIAAWVLFVSLGLASAVGFREISPRLESRGVEWAFYEAAAHALRPDEPVVFLYDDWDRDPYYTPFGPVPHDLAVRLFYLERPASWYQGVKALAAHVPAPLAVIARARDLPALRSLGRVETLLQGPTLRSRFSRVDDRTFGLYRVSRQ